MAPSLDVPAREDATLTEAHRRLVRAVVVLGMSYTLAYAASLFVIESVMLSGLVLSGLGIWAARVAHRAGSHTGVLLGVGVVVLSLTLFVTVNVLHWSPSAAREPFAVVGAVAATFMLGLSVLAIQPRRRRPVDTLSGLRHTPTS